MRILIESHPVELRRRDGELAFAGILDLADGQVAQIEGYMPLDENTALAHVLTVAVLEAPPEPEKDGLLEGV